MDTNKSIIYIDNIFLNRALCYTLSSYSEKYFDKFTDTEWDSNINSANISELSKYLIEYSSNTDENYNWLGLEQSEEVDVIAFDCDKFHFDSGVYTNREFLYVNKTKVNIIIKTVNPSNIYNSATFDNEINDSALAPLIDLHISKNRILKTYKSICLVGIDKYFNALIEKCYKRKFPIMRYTVKETVDIGGLIVKDQINNNNILSQDIKYPIARMWGLKHEEL